MYTESDDIRALNRLARDAGIVGDDTQGSGWTWTYHPVAGGTIKAPDGRSCWLPPGEARELDRVLSATRADRFASALAEYDHVCT